MVSAGGEQSPRKNALEFLNAVTVSTAGGVVHSLSKRCIEQLGKQYVCCSERHTYAVHKSGHLVELCSAAGGGAKKNYRPDPNLSVQSYMNSELR